MVNCYGFAVFRHFAASIARQAPSKAPILFGLKCSFDLLSVDGSLVKIRIGCADSSTTGRAETWSMPTI